MNITLRCECYPDYRPWCPWCKGDGTVDAQVRWQTITPHLKLGHLGSHYITEPYTSYTTATVDALADDDSIQAYATYCAVGAICWLGAAIRDTKTQCSQY